MLAKLTAKNQLTLPKSVTQALGPAEYFDVEAREGQIILTPVRIQRGDAVRAKLAELALGESDIRDAVAWARSAPSQAAHVAEPEGVFRVGTQHKRAAGKKVASKSAGKRSAKA